VSRPSSPFTRPLLPSRVPAEPNHAPAGDFVPPELRPFAVGSAAADRCAARAQQAAPDCVQAARAAPVPEAGPKKTLFRLVLVSAHTAPALDPDDAARAPPRPAPPHESPLFAKPFVRRGRERADPGAAQRSCG
jgi:hypothetical protein